MKSGEKEIQKQNIQQLLNAEYTTKQIAASLGISEGTVINRKKEIAQSATNGVILHGAAQMAVNKAYIDPIAELYTIHQDTKMVYQEALRRFSDMLKSDEFDPTAVLTITKELRADLELQVKITEKIFNADRMRVFRECIYETLDETHPKLKEEFIKRLNSKKEMHGTTAVF